jgi:hypothetical protein
MSRTARTGPTPSDPLDTNPTLHSVPPGSDILTGRTYAAPPCDGRRLWLAVVLTCPACGGAHHHRVGDASLLLSGRVVKVCPVNKVRYALRPVQRRREARRASA